VRAARGIGPNRNETGAQEIVKKETANFSCPSTPFPADENMARLERLRKKMAAEKFDAVLIQDSLNRLYFTGLESSNGLLTVANEEKPLFFTDSRYLEMARKQIGFMHCSAIPRENRFQGLTRLAARKRWRRVGYDGSDSPSTLERMKSALPEVKDWASAQPILNGLRDVKSVREQTALRSAVRMGDLVFERALAQIKPGMTEWDIRVLMRRLMDEVSQGESFDTIVAAGANASRPHHQPSLRKLRRGDELLIDMGVKVNGYCSDMTRVVFFGPPSPKLREIYRIVLAANRRAIAGLRAGITTGEADALARKVIDKAGYGKQFTHSLGHGVGLHVHDPVAVRANGKDVLKPGMVVTVEPGIYLPGVGGVRIEDMVLVRRNDCEVLTATPKKLLIL
jgi:Xaa-Pro aminopeptidase